MDVAAVSRDRRVRYVAAGGVSAVVYYALFSAGWLLVPHRLPYLAIAFVCSSATAVLTYPIYRCVVFQAGGGLVAGFLRFYALCLWAMLFSLTGLWALVEAAGLNVLFAQAVIIVLGPLINYQAARLWAFRF
jgi:putative flippase GtrA